MTFNETKDKILVSLAGIAIAILTWIATSVSNLNTNIAVVIERVAYHDREITELKTDVKELQKVK